MQKKSIISKGKYSFAQAENIVSAKQYFFVRDEKGQKRLLLRFSNDRNEVCTGFAFVVRFLDSRGRVIDEEEYESGAISVGAKSSFTFEESIFVDERCCNFKVEVLHAYYGNYKYNNENGAVSVEYEKSPAPLAPSVNLSKIKAQRKIRARFFKLPMIYVWLAVAILTVAVLALSVQLFVFKLTQNEFTIDGISYEFVSSDKEGDVVITGHSGSHTNLLIPSEIEGHRVVGIQSGAFLGNSKIKKVRIEGVDIGREAFAYCSNLTEVQIDSVSSIGDEAFVYCSKLNKISVTSETEDVLDIGSRAFAGCNALKTVSIDQFALYNSGYAIFEQDYNIETLHLKNYAYEIEGYEYVDVDSKIWDLFRSGGYFMYQTPKLRTLTIDYIDAIASGFCEEFPYLSTFAVRETSIPTIGSYAFNNCISLSTFELKSPVSKVEERAFSNTAIKRFNGAELSQIGDYAFSGCDLLEHFNLSGNETLLKIGRNAFINCRNLKTIVLPTTLTVIGEGAFENSGLTSFTLSSSSTTVERGVLAGCTDVEELNLAYLPSGYVGYLFGYSKQELSASSYELDNVRKIKIVGEKSTIDSYAFAYCSGLQTVTLANSVTEIGDYAFYSCQSLSGINLGDSIEVIGESAFYNCQELSSINLGEKLTSVGAYAFEGAGIEFIVIPPSADVGEGILFDCYSLKEVTLPIGDDGIGYYFSKNWVNIPSSLKKITVNGADAINGYAFFACSEVEEIVICEGVTTIYDYAFDGCRQLRKLILPKSINDIASNAFYGCYKLYEIYNQSEDFVLTVGSDEIPYTLYVSKSIDEMAPTVNVDGCYFAKYGDKWYLVDFEDELETLAPAAVFTYKFAGGMSEIVTSWAVPHALFYSEDSRITSIELPASVTEIGKMAFKNCYNRMTVTIDKNAPIYVIEDECFANSSNITSVSLPSSVERIGTSAFSCCYSLKSVDMPSGLLEIEEWAFEYCSSLKSIVLYENVYSIGEGAFTECSNLHDIYNLSGLVIREGSTDYYSMARDAFVHYNLDTPLSEVVTISGVGEFRNSGDRWMLIGLDYGARELDTTALRYRGKQFTSIRINEFAAEYRSALESVILGENVVQIQNDAFRNCENLRTVDMSRSKVTEIESGAFRYCSRMIEASLPSNLKTISSYAFGDCSKLLSITLPSTLENIENQAFFGCVELFEVYDLSPSVYVYQNSNNGYVGYYAKKILTSEYESALERRIEGGMYFVLVDGIYYLHHFENVDYSSRPLQIPSIGTKIAIMPSALYNCNASSVIMPTSVVEIDYYDNGASLDEVYYEGDYSQWNRIAFENGYSSWVYYYDICVHQYDQWTYKNGEVSTSYCDVKWTVTVEPTCQSEGYEVGRCACGVGCDYEQGNYLSTVDHKIENDTCVYCKKQIVKLTSENLKKYESQFEITLENFEINNDGTVSPITLGYGMSSSFILTAKSDTVLTLNLNSTSYGNSFIMYYDYGYGFSYYDEINGYRNETITVNLSKGESYKVMFISNSYSADRDGVTAFLDEIYILVKQ